MKTSYSTWLQIIPLVNSLTNNIADDLCVMFIAYTIAQDQPKFPNCNP